MSVIVQQPGTTTVVTQSPANEEVQGFITLPNADQLFMCCACCCSGAKQLASALLMKGCASPVRAAEAVPLATTSGAAEQW